MMKLDFTPSRSALRQFGVAGAFAFPLIALVVSWRFLDWQMNWGTWLLLGLGGTCALLALLAPAGLKPIYLAMLLIGAPIGFLVSTIVLALIYYLLFTPMALIFKLIGRDTMQRTLDRSATSYWSDHADRHKPRGKASYLRLY